jgi:hypothetical protein
MMIWGGLASGAICAGRSDAAAGCFRCFHLQIISQPHPVFGGNPEPLTTPPMTEQPEIWLFRRCFS